MRRLMLLRHAKTETDAPSGRDQDRRLDARGRKDAAEIGEWIGTHPPRPDAVMVSPAMRAKETWDIASEAIKRHAAVPGVEWVAELYGADSGQLLQIIRNACVNDPKRLMLIGHNPGMHELALALVGSSEAKGHKALADNLPTSGLAVFDFAVDDWNEVGFRRGKLAVFMSPKLLRQA